MRRYGRVVDPSRGTGRLLRTLEQLHGLEATEVRPALEAASELVAEALNADKIDIFLFEEKTDTLVALGVSATPMGEEERSAGLDRLPLANGGRAVEVYRTGEAYSTGRADSDPGILPGVKGRLGVRSMMAVPLSVHGNRRGILTASCARPDVFTEVDAYYLSAVAHWIGMLVHRAELVERLTHAASEQGRQVLAEELITVLAHDLGNYVTPVRGRVELIIRRASREGRERDSYDAGEALHGLDRIQKLITDLLDASRLDQGFFTVTPQPVNLMQVVRESAALFGESGGNIVVYGPDDVAAESDPHRIGQIIQNLLSNAVQYTPLGSPITVHICRSDGDTGCEALIEVRDQGPGIAPDLLPIIFDRFRSGPESKGLGLGLYLSRGIAEAHGGTLTVESRPGGGTAVRLALPCD